MENVKVGDTLPPELSSCLILGEDCPKIITTSPAFVLLSLTNVSETEREAFHGPFDLAYSNINRIPTLVVRYSEGFSFDMPIFNVESRDPEENSFFLFLIESTTMEILGIRVLGVKHEITSEIIKDTVALEGVLTKEAFEVVASENLKDHSTEEIFARAEHVQLFK